MEGGHQRIISAVPTGHAPRAPADRLPSGVTRSTGTSWAAFTDWQGTNLIRAVAVSAAFVTAGLGQAVVG